MEKIKAKWVAWGVDDKTIDAWLQFKEEQYLKDITLDTEKRATYNPGGLLRKRIRDGDTIRRAESVKPLESKISDSNKIYSREENRRWYSALEDKQKQEAYAHANWKFPWLQKHMLSAGQSHSDDINIWSAHWTFGMFMQVLERHERAPYLEL